MIGLELSYRVPFETFIAGTMGGIGNQHEGRNVAWCMHGILTE
jgi:hypothetical protein